VVLEPIDGDVVHVEDGEFYGGGVMLLSARSCQCHHDDMVLPV
jgi:hypothetical protein